MSKTTHGSRIVRYGQSILPFGAAPAVPMPDAREQLQLSPALRTIAQVQLYRGSYGVARAGEKTSHNSLIHEVARHHRAHGERGHSLERNPVRLWAIREELNRGRW